MPELPGRWWMHLNLKFYPNFSVGYSGRSRESWHASNRRAVRCFWHFMPFLVRLQSISPVRGTFSGPWHVQRARADRAGTRLRNWGILTVPVGVPLCIRFLGRGSLSKRRFRSGGRGRSFISVPLGLVSPERQAWSSIIMWLVWVPLREAVPNCTINFDITCTYLGTTFPSTNMETLPNRLIRHDVVRDSKENIVLYNMDWN